MYEIYEMLLERAGESTADVCRATGIYQSTISNWKKRRNKINPKYAKLIADHFGVSVDFLMYGTESEKESVEGMKYYFSDETAELAQAMYEDDELRLLADGLRKVSKEDLAAVIAMVEVMKRKENKE